MRSNRNRLTSNEPLLATFRISDHEHQMILLFKKHQNSVIVIIIMIGCAPIAFCLSSLYIHYFETPFSARNLENDLLFPSFDPKTTPASTSTFPTTISYNISTCHHRIVGYYTNSDSLNVTDNQLQKLTHLIFRIVKIDSNGTIQFMNSGLDERFVEIIARAKSLNTDLKVMIGIGDSSYRLHNPITPLVTDPVMRAELINTIIGFLIRYDIDGVDIFWSSTWRRNAPNYVKFIEELRIKLKSFEREYTISLIVAPSITKDEYNRHHLRSAMNHVDFISVLSYNMLDRVGFKFLKFIGPTSPLFGGIRGNLDERMRYFTCATRQPEKLNMVVLFYGTYWNNVTYPFDDSTDDIWSLTDTNNNGYQVSWKEFKRSGWNENALSWHEKSKSSYIWNPETRTFLGLETKRSIREKMKYANVKHIGGVSIWSLDKDDDEETLLNVVTSEKKCLMNGENSVDEDYICYNLNVGS
uniref:Glyco_18 domain-containing protein n=1 Tax=Caenorhabditis tropicalis TaxID=1561998 RepID=A0A1I7UCH1_9PELO